MSLRNKVALLLVILTLISGTSIAFFQFQFIAKTYSKEIDTSLLDASKAFASRVSERNQLLLARAQYDKMGAMQGNRGSINPKDKSKVTEDSTTSSGLIPESELVFDNYSFISEKDYSQIDIEVFNIDGEVLFTPTSGAIEVSKKMLSVFKKKKPLNLDLIIDGVHYRGLVSAFNNTQAALFLRSYSEFDNFVSENLRFSFLALTFTLFIALSLGFLAGGRVTKSIKLVTENSKLIAEKNDYTIRFDSDLRGEAGELGRTLNLVLDNLALTKEEQQRMIENANHELKTPLTSMLTNLALLQKIDSLSEEDLREVIEELNREARELSKLVNELIILSRGESLPTEAEEIDVLEKIREIAGKLTLRTSRAVEIKGESFIISWSIEDFERLFSNIIENANKFDSSTQPLLITLKDKEVIVEDSGPGFRTDELQYAKERFFRGINAQQVEGSGLGLAIAESITQKYGAVLQLGNKESETGARVRVIFN